MRLRTVSCQSPGWRRVRHGRGFRYLDEHGQPLTADEVESVKSLAIPPAWSDVWICPDDRGHLQAVGTDDAGRRQYIYHPEWRRKRDEAKFDRAIELGKRMGRVRTAIRHDLEGEPTELRTVIAAALRMIDLGCFRLGSEEYAAENGSFGLSTLQVGHVSRVGAARVFSFVGKGGIDQEVGIDEPAVVRVVDALCRRRRKEARLLAVRGDRRWRPVGADEINQRIRDLAGLDVTAKDIRTWKATVRVASELASAAPARSDSARAKQLRVAVTAAADLLGNTPAVARQSYVDPRVIDLFHDGRTIGHPRSENGLDRAVVRLLTD